MKMLTSDFLRFFRFWKEQMSMAKDHVTFSANYGFFDILERTGILRLAGMSADRRLFQ